MILPTRHLRDDLWPYLAGFVTGGLWGYLCWGMR